jgi:hypothetical protein
LSIQYKTSRPESLVVTCTMSTPRSNFQSRKRAIKTAFKPLNKKKVKKKQFSQYIQYILLDQLVLDSIVQKMKMDIGKQIGLELVSKSFAISLRFTVYPQYQRLRICDLTDLCDENENDAENPKEDVFEIDVCKKWSVLREDKKTYKGHEAECLAVIFARFRRIFSLSVDSPHHWKINEMILRAIDMAKCDLPDIECMNLHVALAPKTIHITTPALFADSLFALHISHVEYDEDFDYKHVGFNEYFGEYTERLDLDFLTLRHLPLPSFDCLENAFGHMSNLQYLNLINTPMTNTNEIFSHSGTVTLLSQLRTFYLEWSLPSRGKAENQIEFDDMVDYFNDKLNDYINLCYKLPASVELQFCLKGLLFDDTTSQLRGKISQALHVASNTRATVTLEELDCREEKETVLVWAEMVTEIIQSVKKASNFLIIGKLLKNSYSPNVHNYRFKFL